MRKSRGFSLDRKLVKLWKWVSEPKRQHTGYTRLDPAGKKESTKTANRCNFWGGYLKKKKQQQQQQLLHLRSDAARDSKGLPDFSSRYHVDQKPAYCPSGSKEFDDEFKGVPKGHLAVYVGQRDEQHRFLVPVIYFNHPLFGELLREAEEEYGYHHPGGITIPCRVSDFKTVQTRIAGESGGRKSTSRRL